VNFTGQLFRCFPEPYQILLDTGNGKTRLVQSSMTRPGNSEFREALSKGLKIQGVTENDLRMESSLVWWEKETDKAVSSNWKD
jgi:hypothetical protein